MGPHPFPSAGRSRLAAALLAFFLGGFGAHWFYLGRSDWAAFYLAGTVLSFFLSFVFLGLVGFLFIGILCLYDFITLLSMNEAEFQIRYNQS